ncbi:thioredoxin family protein [Massilia sp. PAMC28688]|uniref:thioredoxin family protein n=1 Tax=Massilia sp. PAMC28688 TaxID=2861283 RepID=UPI001C635425|nr:thioredoxin family protein [Massilia sp. PAMC28688]QYF92448.1 thioredoxin family protein [Massilia sp. PAMC28688]
MSKPYSVEQPERSAVDAMDGIVALEFGADWCGHCKAAQPLIQAALGAYPSVQHIKVEDGSGRKLGRSLRVKLWPTVVVLRQGQELARVVRPADEEEVRRALATAD